MRYLTVGLSAWWIYRKSNTLPLAARTRRPQLILSLDAWLTNRNSHHHTVLFIERNVAVLALLDWSSRTIFGPNVSKRTESEHHLNLEIESSDPYELHQEPVSQAGSCLHLIHTTKPTPGGTCPAASPDLQPQQAISFPWQTLPATEREIIATVYSLGSQCLRPLTAERRCQALHISADVPKLGR